MKILRLIILLVFVAPISSFASDSCCAPQSCHSGALAFQVCDQTQSHFEAADHDCCQGKSCKDCAACHLPSYSPITTISTSALFAQDHLALADNTSFPEIVFAVLTPPPTL